MADHPFDQGLVWAETPDGPEQVCRVCGGRAVDHDTRPAVWGRIPWPVSEVGQAAEPLEKPRQSLWHRLTRDQEPGPADHVRFGPVLHLRVPVEHVHPHRMGRQR